jgi:acetyl-CoA carboxylase, biotin carboxylase subunit
VRGHAIEARILAEDPANNFSPSPGRITHWRAPTGAGVRVDSGFGAGSMVPPFYDSMIAKLIVYGRNRDEALERLIRALANFEVQGIATNLPLLIAIATHDDFRSNDISTRWLESTLLPSFASRGSASSP